MSQSSDSPFSSAQFRACGHELSCLDQCLTISMGTKTGVTFLSTCAGPIPLGSKRAATLRKAGAVLTAGNSLSQLCARDGLRRASTCANPLPLCLQCNTTSRYFALVHWHWYLCFAVSVLCIG